MRLRLRSCSSLRSSSLLWAFLLILLVGAGLTSLLPSARRPRAADDTDYYGDILLEQVDVQRRATTGREVRAGEGGAGAPQGEEFTIVVQTFNRTDVLLKLLNHYQAAPHVQRIIVVWNNIGQEPPRALWEALGPHPVQVVFKEQIANRMRNRLQAFAEIDTDVVLMLDDDTLVSFPDVGFAFSVWKQTPEQIVGFVPRTHVSGPGGVYTYGSFEMQNPELGGGGRYSMVLIGAAFFRRRYLQLFQEQPAAVHELVDQTQNCDDVVMNFIVALDLKRRAADGAPCRPSGVFVKPVDFRNLEKEASSGYQGMWHRAEHLLQRSYCLNTLAKIYGSMPLCFSNIMVSQFGFPSYANHKFRG